MTTHPKNRKEVIGRTFMSLVWDGRQERWELCVGQAYNGGLDRTCMPDLHYSDSYEELNIKFEETKKIIEGDTPSK